MPPPRLTTKRLVLRPPRLEDAPAYQRFFADWEVVRFLSRTVPWPYPPDGARRYLEEVLLAGNDAGHHLCWALAPLRSPDLLIGTILYRLRQGAHEGDRGFWLARPYQRRGLMTEAVAAVQDHLFFQRGVDRLVVCNSTANIASRRVEEKTGATFLRVDPVPACREGNGLERWVVTRERWARVAQGTRSRGDSSG